MPRSRPRRDPDNVIATMPETINVPAPTPPLAPPSQPGPQPPAQPEPAPPPIVDPVPQPGTPPLIDPRPQPLPEHVRAVS